MTTLPANLPEISAGMTITRYDAARKALCDAHSVDEVKEMRDKALALAEYARQANDTEMHRWVTEIKLRAERKAGEMLAEQVRHQGGRPAKRSTGKSVPKGLKDLGISDQQSSDWQKIAKIEEKEFERAIASPVIVTTKKLVNAVRAAERDTKHEPKIIRPLPDGVYNCIYADPPWRFGDGTTDPSRTIENQYPTLSLDEIKALPVQNIAAKDCVLFLWSTAPLLRESMEVIPAWGFQYKSCAVWDKQRIGMGHYFRIDFELLLISTRGCPGTPPDGILRPAIYRERRGGHSVKPEYFRKTIEDYYPSAKRVELFARTSPPGWEVWGNETQL